jgi:hypothetical protein
LPHVHRLPPEHPQAEGRVIVAPDRRPTAGSSPELLAPYTKPDAPPAARAHAADPAPARTLYRVEGPNATRGRIIVAPRRTPTRQSSPEVLRQYREPVS